MLGYGSCRMRQVLPKNSSLQEGSPEARARLAGPAMAMVTAAVGEVWVLWLRIGFIA
jgi:hypothetical protein